MTHACRLRLEVGGQRVTGVIEGSNDRRRPMVVYLHGFGSQARSSKGDFFSSRFVASGSPFCRFDLRGHGESGGELSTATVERNLDDLDAVVADLRGRGWRRFVLVGSSYGALTALVHAARAPQAIAAVVGVSAAVGLADSIRRREGSERLAAWREAGEAPLGDERGALSWDFYTDAQRWRTAELADRLQVPALLFHGLQDAEVDWRGPLELAQLSGRVQLHGFIGGDHRLVEQLPRIWEETEHFLRSWVDRDVMTDE